ncbi:MAG: hypothetical protein AB7S26_35250 [Sandaracinaceae bacterium]
MDATAQDLIGRLRRNPDDADAFAALRAHYQRIGDYASLANLLEGWAGRSRDPRAAAHAMFEAGELVLGALSDRERAVRMYERALAIDPRHQDAFLRLRGLYEDTADTRRLAELLERHGAALTKVGADPRDVALIYHQLGELWEHRMGRVDKAVHHYRRAFELDGNLIAAIYAAREIYRNAGNIKAAATLLEKEAKAELDPTRRLALWRELAHTKAEQLDDQEGAALALKRALGEAPGDLEVMGDLARVYLARADRSGDPHVAESDRHRAADLLYQMAQQVPPDHSLPYLEQALDSRPDHEGAMTLYERVCEDMRQSARLPGRWVAYLARAADRPETAVRRKRLAQAYLDAGQVEYAITCLEWLLDDGDPEAAEMLVDLYRQQGREDDAIRALGVAASSLPPNKRLPRLREMIQALRDRGDLESAASFAEQILALEPNDPEALHLLEESCRQSGDYGAFRGALLAASRASGLSPAERLSRLKQVAMISENRMGDRDGAISAWRGVASLDPSDVDARSALKRLLEETARWDELVDLLEREALAITDPDAKADVYRQIALVHRDRRDDLKAAVNALRKLRELLPGDRDARDMLSDALVGAGAYLEAIPLLRARVDETSGPGRANLLRTLAEILEGHIGDEDGAYECWARLLDENPTDLDAVEHMIGIDERASRFERLLSTLSYKVEIIAVGPERAAVLARMGSIAEEELRDLMRSAELYARALEYAPSDPAVLDALCAVYERSDRFKDLVVLLRDTAQREEDPAKRAELYRRIARTLSDSIANDEGAAEAWREVLLAGEDEEALRFLKSRAESLGDQDELEQMLQRLAAVVASEDERRDLYHQRALVLADRLDRPQEAADALRQVIAIQADHVGALQKLANLCEQIGDRAGLADALWRQLGVVEDPGLRVPVARRLSDLHEREAPDPTRAIEALEAWAAADVGDDEPLARLEPLLEQRGMHRELIDVLDRRAGLADEASAASELTRRAAQICYRQLGDVDGAWQRLLPRVRDLDDAEAERALRELARSASRGEKLAEMYVTFAQATNVAAEQAKRWMDAAEVYETYLDNTPNALEAVLRAFAADLTNFACLDEADRLAKQGNLWDRLSQVYETLIRRTEDPVLKVELLLRHAERLEDPSAALDQTLRACSLAPNDDAVLALAEERAPKAGRADELLVTYDKRRSMAEDDAARIDALLRSARLSEVTLRERERATHYLAQAVALSVRSPELADRVDELARELDMRPGAARGLEAALVAIYAALADDLEDDPVGGARLLRRSASLLSERLGKAPEAFEALKRAASFAPSDAETLDELESFARRLGEIEALDAHLAHLIEEALDSRTASLLLERRGDLLEKLNRFKDAAEVWTRLKTVTSGAPNARKRLRTALRKAGEYQDLLVALQRDLRDTEAVPQRIRLLKEIALVWEEGLGNRWEAIDAWKKVLDAAPGDPDGVEALARIEEGRRRQDDSNFEIAAPPPDSSDAEGLLDADDADVLDADVLDADVLDADVLDADVLDADVLDDVQPIETGDLLASADSIQLEPASTGDVLEGADLIESADSIQLDSDLLESESAVEIAAPPADARPTTDPPSPEEPLSDEELGVDALDAFDDDSDGMSRTDDVGRIARAAFADLDEEDDDEVTPPSGVAIPSPDSNAPSPGATAEPPITANVRAPRETRLLNASSVKPDSDVFGLQLTPSGEAPALAEDVVPRRDPDVIASSHASAPSRAMDEVSAPHDPGMADEDDYEDDYTAVAEDVFDALDEPAEGMDALGTAEIDLLAIDEIAAVTGDDDVADDAGDTSDLPKSDAPPPGALVDGADVMDLDGEAGAIELSDSGLAELEEELEDAEELEDLDDLDDLEEAIGPPATSKPPPPPPRKR